MSQACLKSPVRLSDLAKADTLLLCGVTTEVCVHSTLREAVDRGYACLTVVDACASSNPALQEAALAMIAVEGGIFGAVAATARCLEMLAAR